MRIVFIFSQQSEAPPDSIDCGRNQPTKRAPQCRTYALPDGTCGARYDLVPEFLQPCAKPTAVDLDRFEQLARPSAVIRGLRRLSHEFTNCLAKGSDFLAVENRGVDSFRWLIVPNSSKPVFNGGQPCIDLA